MSVNATDAGRPLPTSDGPRRQEAAERRPQETTDAQPDETSVYVTPNAVIIAKPGHTKIEADHGSDHGKPLTATTRNNLELIEEMYIRGGIA